METAVTWHHTDTSHNDNNDHNDDGEDTTEKSQYIVAGYKAISLHNSG